MTISKCRFCAFIQNSTENTVDMPWLADSEYFAVASIGALVDGWSLVCPIDHALNLKDHYRTERFWDFANKAIEIVRDTYGPVALFEHGAVCENSQTSCGTAHAHLHVVPFSARLSELVLERDPSLTWMECTADQVTQLADGQEYLFVLCDDASLNSKGRLAKLESGQSQFFRKVIADWLGRSEEFSYKTHPQSDASLRTALVLQAQAAKAIHIESNAA